MADNKENEDLSPSKKRRRLLSLKSKKKENRFHSVSSDFLGSMAEVKFPTNTAKSSKWAMANFSEWFDDYNKRNEDNPCPPEVVTNSCSKEVLNKWLCVYINETRNRNGERYPPSTLQSLLSGILRFMKQGNPNYPNFFNKDDPAFSRFQTTLNNLFKNLRSDGVGAQASHTETISAEEEDTLWTSGVLNTDTPLGLLRCVFFYNGKCFCLRGGQEHRDLGPSQLKRLYNPDRYVYSEKSSKNRPGGSDQIRLEHKTVPIYANAEAGIRCHVFLLDMYLDLLPDVAVEKDFFYCKPCPNVFKAHHSWYYPIPVGKNVLGNMVKDMAAEAGLSGKKTNHSLRVAGATSLYRAGVPERIIQERTGHRNLLSLRQYERTSSDQDMAVSRILSGEVDKYDTTMEFPILSTVDEVENDGTKESVPKLTEATVKNEEATKESLPTSSSPTKATVKSEDEGAGKQPGGIQYNNCTVNVFGGGNAPGVPPPFLPGLPQYNSPPPPFPYYYGGCPGYFPP